jgi:phosphoribosylglycinamide formyltransferase-1
MKHLAIFASGNGTNCENIIKYFADSDIADIRLVISNKSTAPVVDNSQKLGIKTLIVSKQEFNNENTLMRILAENEIDFIVLAGFLLFIPDFLINKFQKKIINIHPALLPKFGGPGMYGIHVHEAVKAAGEKETGMTVHWVSKEIDGGEIIFQHSTPITPDDTIEDIAAKEHELEIKYFPEDIKKILTMC